jgi:hypothetical protein
VSELIAVFEVGKLVGVDGILARTNAEVSLIVSPLILNAVK